MPALPFDYLVAALVTMFVVVDPIGLAPTFLGITAGLPRSSRRQVAFRACLIAFAILAGAAIEERVRNIAAFPLAIPLMAGPGAITATVLLAGRAGGDPVRHALLIGIIATIMALCLIVFLAATRIERMIGVTGNIVLSRLLGVLLAALAVQFVVDGVRVLMAGS
jgi:multiple antibiotic resistance protein